MTRSVVFQALAYGGAAAAFGWYGYRSIRRRRVQPELWLSFGLFSLFWMEAPYDWSMYAAFRPDLPKFPHWGPFVTHGGLPVMAPFGYVAYFLAPTVLAVAVARGLVHRRGWNRVWTLLAAGIAVGFAWDLTMELLGTAFGIWRFSHVAPGLVLFPHSDHQVALYVPLAMALEVMACTYLLGRVDDRGDTIVEALARARSRTAPRRAALTLAGTVLFVHLVYVAAYVPHIITKTADLQTVQADQQLFAGHPNQAR